MNARRIFIATVHWNSNEWVERQTYRARKHIGENIRIFAFMDGVTSDLFSLVDKYFQNSELSHPEKLDYLANRIGEEATPDDILIFLDGDAFPIADISPIIAQLSEYPLVAVRRDENFGDQQPHPCFCITTVGFWQSIAGSWASGSEWERDDGSFGTDVGGKLYGILKDSEVEWRPLLRSNIVDLHPLFFGVYAGCIYHHGAGFRNKLCRRDARTGMDSYSRKCLRFIEICQGKRYLRPLRVTLRRHIYWYMSKRNENLHRRVTALISSEENFARILGFLPT